MGFRRLIIALFAAWTLCTLMHRVALAKPGDAIDLSKPVILFGRPITFGFEAEFKPSADNPLVQGSEDDLQARTDRFPYLSRVADQERSGNLEVRSIGGEWIADEVFEQMTEIRNQVPDTIRGFHLRVRIPQKAIERIPQALLAGHLSLIGDWIHAWRLEKKKPFLALRSVSIGRTSYFDLTLHSVIRMIAPGMYGGPPANAYDIEIRGAMTDLEFLREIVTQIIQMVVEPDRIPKWMERNWEGHLRFQTFGEWVIDKAQRRGHPLALPIKERLLKLNWAYWPAQDLELFPFWSAHEHEIIHQADQKLVDATIEIARLEIYDPQKQWDFVEAERRARAQIQNWAREIGIFERIGNRLKNKPGDSAAVKKIDPSTLSKLKVFLARPNIHEEPLFRGVFSILSQIDAADAVILLELAVPNLGRDAVNDDRLVHALMRVPLDSHPRLLEIFLEMADDGSNGSRQSLVLPSLIQRTDPKSVQVVDKWIRHKPSLFTNVDFTGKKSKRSVEVARMLIQKCHERTREQIVPFRLLNYIMALPEAEMRSNLRELALAKNEFLVPLNIGALRLLLQQHDPEALFIASEIISRSPTKWPALFREIAGIPGSENRSWCKHQLELNPNLRQIWYEVLLARFDHEAAVEIHSLKTSARTDSQWMENLEKFDEWEKSYQLAQFGSLTKKTCPYVITKPPPP